jgi:hypothetical protein
MMSLQKFADQMKAKKDQVLKVFPSGKECVLAMAAGAGLVLAGGKAETTEATDGRAGESAVVLNLSHFLGAVLVGGGASVAMMEGLTNSGKKTKKLSPEEIHAARANQR